MDLISPSEATYLNVRTGMPSDYQVYEFFDPLNVVESLGSGKLLKLI